MGQLALATAGAVVGSYFGAPQIGWIAGSLLGAFLFPARPPATTDTPISASTWGQGISILYGTARLAGNMIWAGPIKQKSNKGGMFGKGGGGASSSKVATRSFAMAFCEGPVTSLVRLWADGKLIYDATNNSLSTSFSTGKSRSGISFYFHAGTEEEVPEPLIAQWVSSNVPSAPQAVPAYRGLCYVMFPDFNMSNFGNRIPNITAEISNSPINSVPAVAFSNFNTANSSLTEVIDPGSALSNTSVAVDWVRGVIYVLAQSSTGGLRVFSLATGQEIRQRSNSLMGTFANFPVAVACAQGGAIYVASAPASGGNTIVSRIDPNSLTVTGAYSISGVANFFSLQIIAQTVIGPMKTRTILVVANVFEGIDYAIIDGDTMQLLISPASTQYVSLPYPSGFGHSTQMNMCQGNVASSGSDVWLVISPDGADPNLYIWKISLFDSITDAFTGIPLGVTVELAGTIHPSDVVSGSSGDLFEQGVAYDQTDGCLVIALSIGGAAAVVKWSESIGVVWTANGLGGINNYANLSGNKIGLVNSGLSGGSWALVDSRSGALIGSPVNVTTAGTWSGNRFVIYNAGTTSIIAPNTGVSSNSMMQVFLGVSGGSSYPLASIIQDVCQRCGLTPSQVDTSLITQNVNGYVVTRNTSGKDILAQLSQAFFFDCVESDYTLKFIPRGGSAATAITQADLASPSSEKGDYWVPTQADKMDTPIHVQINFKDMDNDYQPNSGYYKRQNSPVPTVYNKQKMILDLPVAMHLSDATEIAQTWVATMWMELDKFQTALGWQYLWLDPADSATVNLDSGDTYTVRLTTMNVGADFTIKADLVGEDAQTYVQSMTLQDVSSPYSQKLQSVEYGTLFLLNVPLLQDSDDTGGATSRIYFGAGAYSPNWAGGSLFTSTDGENFTEFDLMTNEVTWGSTVNSIGSTTTPFSTDTSNTIVVALGMQAAGLFSVTDLDLLNGANAALVGNEIIQFRDVAINGDGTLTLSTLLRGRRGTEWACSTHVPGEPFIILDTNLYASNITLSQIGVTTYWKLVPIGAYLDTTPTTSGTFKGYDLKPYAPTSIARAPSGSDLLVTWVRRTRLGGALLDGIGTVPLAEQTESYDAYVLSAPYNAVTANWATPASPVRSFTGLTSPQFTYTAAQMSSDGFVPGSGTLHVVVFQNSAAIGHGWPGAADLSPF